MSFVERRSVAEHCSSSAWSRLLRRRRFEPSCSYDIEELKEEGELKSGEEGNSGVIVSNLEKSIVRSDVKRIVVGVGARVTKFGVEESGHRWQSHMFIIFSTLLDIHVDKSEMRLAMEPYGNWLGHRIDNEVDTRRSYSQVELDEVQVELADFLAILKL
ncbi:putative dual specificity protein phosphatase DSP8 [Cucumis melo var. makuwa]|uniref:Dual specificity protein phosphatase DSP8 n=1 Tax=Cucumis melo var. makuwa TaxID=1194695 RepID=A0A5A7TJG2_CUCMM|nr:putative dual specificity protein phosphatase DSP8 [Cucumis melo var. makuwa]